MGDASSGGELLALARSQPVLALKQIDQKLESKDLDDSSRTRLFRAAGLAARLTGDLPRSNRYLDHAVEMARRCGDDVAFTEAQVTRAGNLLLSGRSQDALDLLIDLRANDQVGMAAQLGIQIGTIYARTSQFERSVAELETARNAAQNVGDDRLVAAITKNRGMVLAYTGHHQAATADLLAARATFERLGIEIEVAYCDHNLGLVAAYSGDLPRAFEHFLRSEAEIARLAGSEWEVQVSRCEALLSAGLSSEAAELAASLARQMSSADQGLERGDALLVEAQARSLLGEAAAAVEIARQAIQLFEAHDQRSRLAQARILELTNSRAAGIAVRRESVEAILASGSTDASSRVGVATTIAAAEAESAIDPAGSLVRLAGLKGRLRNAPIDIRLAERTIVARARYASGDKPGAERAALAAVSMLLDYQTVLGSGDLRVGVAAHAREVTRIGIDLAVGSGNPRRIFSWLERSKSLMLQNRGVVPESDRELREALTELRSLAGIEAPDNQVRKRQQLAELRVRDLSRVAVTRREATRPERAEAVLDELGGRVLLSYGEHEDQLFAVKLASRRATRLSAGTSSEAARAARSVRAELRRIATVGGEASRVQSVLERLDSLLGEPGTDGAAASAAVIICPTPELFAVPWGALPSLAGRRVVITPSATMWASRTDRTSAQTRVVLVSGPGLEQGESEIARLAAVLPQAVVMVDPHARTEQVLQAMDGASLVHMVCHGTTRIDNPLFSSLQVSDGNINVYELQQLDRPPSLVVLSACHVGLPAQKPGQELLGLVGAFLSLGTRAVIASTLPLPDDHVTGQFMAVMHSCMAEGSPPSEAMVAAQQAVPDDVRPLYAGALAVYGSD